MRTWAPIVLWVAVAAAGLTAGCRRAPAWPPGAAPVALGEEACRHCRMIITDERSGAQRHARSGEVRHYDDVGCLRADAGAGAVEPAGVFVRSWRDGSWVRGDRAWIVRAHDLRTPMGSGLAGFATREEANAEAARHAGTSIAPLEQVLAAGAAVSIRDATNH